jgi:hypothetical protein
MFVAGRSLKKHHENVRVNVFNTTGITVSASRCFPLNIRAFSMNKNSYKDCCTESLFTALFKSQLKQYFPTILITQWLKI